MSQLKWKKGFSILVVCVSIFILYFINDQESSQENTFFNKSKQSTFSVNIYTKIFFVTFNTDPRLKFKVFNLLLLRLQYLIYYE